MFRPLTYDDEIERVKHEIGRAQISEFLRAIGIFRTRAISNILCRLFAAKMPLSASHRLPYIPPPDYTLRLHAPPAAARVASPPLPSPPPSSPSALARRAARDDPGQPHHYQPDVRPVHRPPRAAAAAAINVEDDEPAEPPRNQAPEAVQKRISRMLKEQGVSVLPTTQRPAQIQRE